VSGEVWGGLAALPGPSALADCAGTLLSRPVEPVAMFP